MNKDELLDFGIALLRTVVHIGLCVFVWWIITRLLHEDFPHFLGVAGLGLWASSVFRSYLRKDNKI
jgi:hypothetical protein